MLLAMHLIYKSLIRIPLIAALFFTLWGCSLSSTKKTPQRKQHTIYLNSKFEHVWRAAQISLSKYPLATNNLDKGLLKTQMISSYDIWKPAHVSVNNYGGKSYTIKIKILRGRYNGKKITKVIVKKSLQRRKDFFSGEESLMSDGLEEQKILYRIKRELIIERIIERRAS